MPQVQLHYITLSYTTCITLHYTPLHSISSPVTLRHFCVAGVAGVALGNIDLRCRVAGVALMGLGWVWWPSWVCLVALTPVTPRHFCVAGMALGDTYHRFMWPAWNLATATFVFEWQACHLWDWAWVWTPTVVSRGRRGTWQHGPSFWVAGVALMGLVARLGALGRP